MLALEMKKIVIKCILVYVSQCQCSYLVIGLAPKPKHIHVSMTVSYLLISIFSYLENLNLAAVEWQLFNW